MTALPAGAIAPPLDSDQTASLHDAIRGLTPGQLHWVSGYVAGLAASAAPAAVETTAASEPGESLAVLYGSQTGNGRGIAEALAADARRSGLAVRLQSLAEFRPASLKRERRAVFVVSTHGEGEPPDDAELFHEFLMSDRPGNLSQLKYAVLALGDSSYVNYCQTGREFDTRLAELGAERIAPLVECDLDFAESADGWRATVIERLPAATSPPRSAPLLRAVSTSAASDSHQPVEAEVLVNQKITGAGSGKDVRHIELSLQGSGLSYEPGDALAVIVDNPPQLVDELLEATGLDAAVAVELGGRHSPLGDALARELEITGLNLGFLSAWAAASGSEFLATLSGDRAALADFIDTHQVIDVVRAHPAPITPDELVRALRRLTPRSYSIASSLRANPDEVHLTVAAVRYEAFGRRHWGAGSTFLADRVAEGETVRVFVESNPRFRLPADHVPIIMIAAGTGVAPYRAFVEERAERGASGDNWLIFGERNFASDFLYQLEWQRHLKHGHLQRLDVAFSRDQRHKNYVQHRIREHAADIHDWLERDAVIYVCGDARHMAGDVDAALAEVIATRAGIGTDAAVRRLKQMRRDGRYQRDVY